MQYSNVSVGKVKNPNYPNFPFDPPAIYPEFSNLNYKVNVDKSNEIYSLVREIIFRLGLDAKNYNTEKWKPFKDLLPSGGHVVLKPNFVKGNHLLGRPGVEATITNASIMRPIIDYLIISTSEKCKITIADVPLQSSVWEEIITQSGVDKLVNFYDKIGIKIDLLDLRKEISILNEELIITKREFKDRDPRGYVTVNLGGESAFSEIIDHSEKLMITDYDKYTVSKHHNKNKNEYYIAKTILDADLFINLPKLKTHKKTGITVAAKNLIGINGDKRWIAHHREGSPQNGGDEFPEYNYKDWIEFHLFAYLKRHEGWGVRMATMIRKIHRNIFYFLKSVKNIVKKGKQKDMFNSEYIEFEKRFPGITKSVFDELNPKSPKYIEGNWYGNDTLWRTISDLNWIVLYANKEGKMRNKIQRNYLCFVDGIVAGEGEGPMSNIPKHAGLIIGGFHPLAVDITAATLMGFDYKKIPSIKKLIDHPKINYYKIDPKKFVYNPSNALLKYKQNFKPPISWKGHIELD